jgi:hypothetical protein
MKKISEADLRIAALRFVVIPDGQPPRIRPNAQTAAPLSQAERENMVALVQEVDGDAPSTFVGRGDEWVSALYLGALRRRGGSPEITARVDSLVNMGRAIEKAERAARDATAKKIADLKAGKH